MRALIIRVVVLVLVFSFGSIAFAQDTATYCGDLPAADCTLLTESSQTMSALESASFHFDLNLSLADKSNLLPDQLSFRLVGDGAYAIDKELLSATSSSTPEWMANVIKSISADVTVILELPTELMRTLSPGADVPERLAFDLRLVDGYGYINLSKLAVLDTSGTLPSGWYGLDVAGFYRALLEQQPGSFGNLLPQPDATPIVPSEVDYMSIKRLADAGNMAVFQTSYNFAKMLNDPQIREIFKSAMKEGLGAQGLGTQDTDALIETYVKLFEAMIFNMTQSIGLDDKYVHETEVHMDWQIDLDSLTGAFDSSPGNDSMAFSFILDLSIGLSQFNAAPPIVAPENPTIIPLSMLLPFLMPGDMGRT